MKPSSTRDHSAPAVRADLAHLNPASWQDCKSILCFRPDNMGDVLMTSPAFRALKESVPGRKLTLLTSSAGAAIAPYIPEIDAVIPFDVPWVQPNSRPERDELPQLVRSLKEYAFDAAVIFNVQSQNPLPSALICYVAGIPRVLGYCRENPYELMTDWVPDPEILVATQHEVDRQLNLVSTVGSTTAEKRLSLTVSNTARLQALEWLTQQGIQTGEPWLILHAGVSEAKRRFGAEQYVQAARQLRSESDYQILLTGSKSEWNYVETIRQGIGERAYNLAGAFPLETFIGLVAEAPVLISNNTGPVHIAAALGTPVVVLYAMTNPQHTPWMVPSRVLYFEVPKPLRSKNRLLQHFPEPAEPRATPEGIVQAVHELVGQKVLLPS
ncbi:glycosyltransferase family 9 protein [Larkinella insperata]|uniref:Glycosyltransferase family 9 protein n=1 Tax=Larkinella insperata TaxID=332158 RepID=A0ABW3Q0Y8_9BACT|nr:glycosyltransferase family 9 protein [Larkinella insperata]